MNKDDDSNDELYLTYKTISLHKSDIKCLPPPNYINDLIISFYYEILNDRYNVYSNYFVLLDPVVTMTLISDTSIEDLNDLIFSPLALDKKKYVFIPINDNSRLNVPGSGNHWALCLYETDTSTMFYFDSMGSTINNVKLLIERYEQLSQLKKKITFVTALNNKYQFNMYDCGVFVLAFTEELMEYLKKENFGCVLNGKETKVDFNCIIAKSTICKQEHMKELRKVIKEQIEILRKQKG